jgi:hypothetical protein
MHIEIMCKRKIVLQKTLTVIVAKLTYEQWPGVLTSSDIFLAYVILFVRQAARITL